MIKVAIVGRVNVGKSTLFNSLLGSSVSISWKEPATTRDVVEAIAHSKKRDYLLLDTAGYFPEKSELQKLMEEQTEKAIESADIVIVVFDVKSGITEIDMKIRDKVMRSGKPYIFVVNKVDSKHQEIEALSEFHKLGDDFIMVSALHKKGIDELFEKLDEIADQIESERKKQFEEGKKQFEEIGKEEFDESVKDEEEFQRALASESLRKLEIEEEIRREKEIEREVEKIISGVEKSKAEKSKADGSEDKEGALIRIRVSLVGRPNVGKSSLVNAILGYPRCIVYDEPGTTRDAVRVPFDFDGMRFIFVDTPGVRRKARIEEGTIEFKSVGRSLTAIFVSDVCVLVIDSLEGITHQDKHIASLVERRGRALVVALNKMDVIKELKPAGGIGKIVQALQASAKFISWAYFIPVSAKTRYGIPNLLRAIQLSWRSWTRKLKPSELLKVRERLLRLDFMKRQNPKIFQVGVKPPTFLVYVNEPENLRKHQIMHIAKIIRGLYGFRGTPIHFRVKRHGEKYH